MEKSGIYVECFLQIRMSVQQTGTFTCSRKLLAKELSHNGGYRGPGNNQKGLSLDTATSDRFVYLGSVYRDPRPIKN